MTKTLAEQFGTTADIEMAHRQKLATMARMCASQNMIGLFGHLSLRIQGTELVLVTPGCGAQKTEIRPQDMYVFDVKGNMLHRPGGDHPLPYPAEWRIHTQVHYDRPEIMCVAHLHAPDSTLLGICNHDIVPVFNQGFELGSRVPTWDNPALVLNDDLATELSSQLGHGPACQMRGHGSVVVGETAERAFMLCFGMEENARYQIRAAAIGGHAPFTQEQMDQTMGQRGDLRVANDIWKYFERKSLMGL